MNALNHIFIAAASEDRGCRFRCPSTTQLIRISLVLLCSFAAAREVRASAIGYTLIDLGTLGGSYSAARGINNHGDVVGYSFTSDNSADYSHAFLYSSGVMTDLGTLGGYRSEGNGINDAGLIAGGSDTPEGNPGNPAFRAFLYTSGLMTNLGTLGGTSIYGSIATDINQTGTVVGESRRAGNASSHAFSYSSGLMTDLGTLPGHVTSVALGVNGLDQAVGYSEGLGLKQAVLFSGGGVTDLGVFGGTESVAEDINNAGQIVGRSTYAAGNTGVHAFLYSGGVMMDLGTLPGDTSSGALSINSAGQVVGQSETAAESHGFLYSGGIMTNLNTFIPSSSTFSALFGASAINDLGQIVGTGQVGSEVHAFLLTPTPEPAALWLFGPGAVLLGVRRGIRVAMIVWRTRYCVIEDFRG